MNKVMLFGRILIIPVMKNYRPPSNFFAPSMSTRKLRLFVLKHPNKFCACDFTVTLHYIFTDYYTEVYQMRGHNVTDSFKKYPRRFYFL